MFVIGFDKILKILYKELTFDCIVIIIGMGMMKLILVVLLILVVVNGFIPISDRKISRITLNTLSLAKIALTREEGANDKLKSLLQKYECIEIPCIMFETGLVILSNHIIK